MVCNTLQNDPNYNIRFLECISDKDEFSFHFADHARAGTTYDEALQDQLNNLQRKYQFYDGKEDE